MILDAAKASREGSAAPPLTLLYQQHKEWVRDLALVELVERGTAPDAARLILSAAQVRFQLACDESPNLPDVLCF